MGLKKLSLPKLPEKRNPEQIHFQEKISDSYCFNGGLKPSECANKESNNEYSHKEKMGSKKAVSTLKQMRNGIGVSSLGDKPYKNPAYSNGFKEPVYRVHFGELHSSNSMQIIRKPKNS